MAKVSESDTTFSGSRVSRLPIFLPPIPVTGAIHDWDARSLIGTFAVGDPVTAWTDVVGGTTLTPAGSGIAGATAPILVLDSDGRLGVKCTAASLQSIGAAFARSVPHTITVYGRFHVAPTSLRAIVGSGSGGTAPVLGATSTGVRVYAGSTVALTTTTDTADHTFLGVFGGASTVVRANGLEATGDSGSSAVAQMSVGAYATTFSDFIAKRIVMHVGALSAGNRAAMDGLNQ